jgi:hypothetical protein
MEEYCREIRRICLEVYKLPLDVLLVNVYFGENTGWDVLILIYAC